MRISIAMAVLLLLGSAPAAWAQQKPHRAECAKLSQQIARYERDAGWAHERGNALWERSNREQASRLSARRAGLCPEFRASDPAADFAAFLGTAARVATRWFLPGL